MKNDRQRIMHLIDTLGNGGAEILLKNTIQLLPEFDHVVVYLNKPDEYKTPLIEQGVEVICLNHRGWKSLPFSIIKLKKLIREKKPVIVHSHLFHSTICARLSVPPSVPLVSTLHSLYSKDAFEKNKLSIYAERFTIRKKHALIGVSDHVLKDYLKFVPFAGKRFVLYNFLPSSMFQSKIDHTPGNVVKCVAVGNLKEAKNYRYLLKIFQYLKHENISLDIYGAGALKEELAAFINKEKLNVRLCGQVTNVSEVLQQYHFFLQASLHEGFGLSVIEAMAVKLPVVVSDIPVFREITHELAHFFPLNNAQKAAGVVRSVIANRNKAFSLAEAGFDFVKDNYSAKQYRETLLGIYETLTQQKLVENVQ